MAPPLHMAGNAVGNFGRMASQKMFAAAFGTEILYSLIILFSSLMIFVATRELYSLSNHKGIRYFRISFLFLALAFFIRTFIKFTIGYLGSEGILDIAPRFAGQVTGFIFVYLTTMAAFYLVLSLLAKKTSEKNPLIAFHIISILTGIILVTSRNVLLVFGLMNAILILLLIAAFASHKKKQKNKVYTTYSLLFIFLALNILDIIVPSFFQTFQLLIYLASTVVFLLILYKVLTRAGA